jgi:hypothetical protein
LVSKNSTSLPKSLLDISGVEESITTKIGLTVKKSIAFGGAIIVVLLLWSQMEGFFSDWIYRRTGIMDTKVQIEKRVEAIMDERLKQQQDKYEKQLDEQNQRIIELQKQLAGHKSNKGS